MLDPMDREELLEALRPEQGHTLDLAVGTSFSVDLDALTFAPLAFALLAMEGPPDPTALLAAIQHNADRLALYCDAAQIRAPAKGRKLFALLEPCLLPVNAPRGGAFHPKLWVLRFRDQAGARRHRVLVLSRNLTHDTSWDLLVRFDEDEEGVPLGGDVATTLLRLARLRDSKLTRALARSVRGVRFGLPPPFAAASLRLLGTGRREAVSDPVTKQPGDRLLVVSPFLGQTRLAGLRLAHRDCQVVSRPSELERVGRRALEGWRHPLVLHEAALPDADEGGDGVAVGGLHAKLFVVDRGERSTWYAGSMNATSAAVEENVELCVELAGPRGAVGVGRLLSSAGDTIRFRDLLRRFEPPNEDALAPDSDEEERRRLDAIGAKLAAMPLEIRVESADRGYQLRVHFSGEPPALLPGDRLAVRVVTRAQRHPLELTDDPAASIPLRRKSEISGLIAVTIRGQRGVKRELVLFGRIENDPDDRLDQLLLDLVPDGRRFALLLFLMLVAGEPAAEVGGAARRLLAAGTKGDAYEGRELGIPLYEELVRASARDRDRLVAIDQLVVRLARTAEGRERLPDGFLDLWEAFRPLVVGARR